jgi:iron complex outermembrane receptor protein
MLDTRVTKTFSVNDKSSMKVTLFANNLLDDVARNHSSFIKDQVPLPGRNFGVKFKLSF